MNVSQAFQYVLHDARYVTLFHRLVLFPQLRHGLKKVSGADERRDGVHGAVLVVDLLYAGRVLNRKK